MMHCAKFPEENQVNNYSRSGLTSNATPLLAAFSQLTAANRTHTNICLDIGHGGADTSEQQPDQQHHEKNFISSDRRWNHRQPPRHEHFCKHTFLNDYHPGWQLARKWSIPSCRALIWHPTCCLWTHALHCSLNSTAFQAKSAQPVDPPLWDESAARGGIWGGCRLSGWWGVIP